MISDPRYSVCPSCDRAYVVGREHLCSGDVSGGLDGGTRIEDQLQGPSPASTKRITSITIETHSKPIYRLDSPFVEHRLSSWTMMDQDGDQLPEELREQILTAVAQSDQRITWDDIQSILSVWNDRQYQPLSRRYPHLFPEVERFPQRLAWA